MSRTTTSDSFRVPNKYAQEYLSINAGLTLKPATITTYDSHLTEFITFLNARETTVISASFTDVIEYIEDCVRRGNRKSTLSGKLSVIAELYRHIRLRTDAGDDLNLDPLRFREIDLNHYNTPARIKREALSREEIRRLFDAFDSYRNRLMAIVGIETGLRNSDIRNLQIQHIESDHIHVHDPKNSNPYDVPISDKLAFEFDTWFKHHRPGFSAASNSDYVFPSHCGERLTQNSSLNEIIKEAAERAGIQDIIGQSSLSESQQNVLGTEKQTIEWCRVTVHTLRHSYITLLSQSGVSLPYRQLVANHKNAVTTQGYSHDGNDVFDHIRGRFDPPR